MNSHLNDIGVSILGTAAGGNPFGARKADQAGPIGSAPAGDGRACPLGFTLVELMVVVVVLALGAAMAVPMLSHAASGQARAAAEIIAADLEYAKSMAISSGKTHAIVFSEEQDTYQLEDQDGAVLAHPTKTGFDYVVDFTADSRLNQVDLLNVSFDATTTVKFDYLGSPFNGSDSPLNSGSLEVSAGSTTRTVSVEPVTGIVSIDE